MKPHLLNPISWTEGMLLTPQHFQQNEVYWQHQLWSLMSQVQPYFWGIRRLNLKSEDLAGGQIRIIDLDVIMPDGLAVQTALAGDIEKITEDDAKEDRTRRIYLCVPRRHAAIDEDGVPTARFTRAEGSLVHDEHGHARTASVERIQPAVELRAGHSTPPRYERLPLFEVRNGANGWELTSYHPPLLDMNASTFLPASVLKRLRSLVLKLRSKANLAISMEKERTSESILKLVGELPPMEVLAQSEAHPFHIYLSLARLTGHVVALSDPYVAPPARKYDHNDMAPGFFAMINAAATSLLKLISDYVPREFETSEDSPGTYSVEIPIGMDVDEVLIEVARGGGQTAEHVLAWFSRARIAERSFIGELVHRRAGGMRAVLTSEQKKSRISMQPETTLITLTNDRREPSADRNRLIEDGQTLVIRGRPDGRPDSLRLLVPRTAES